MKDVNDEMARDIAEVLRGHDIDAEPMKDDEYERLEDFDWDVDKYIHQAAVRLHGQDADILHVVTVHSKETTSGTTNKAKLLMKCPEYLLESRGKKDEPISVSFKVKRKGLFSRGEVSGYKWESDCGTGLERRLSEALNQDTSLGDTLVSLGHTNMNVWLQENNYIAINTSKSYTELREVDEFFNNARLITGHLNEFR